MKAILVIDIPKEFENRGPYFVEGTLFYHIDDNPYTNYCYAFNIGKTKLKPFPQNIAKLYKEVKRMNERLNEILGEE